MRRDRQSSGDAGSDSENWVRQAAKGQLAGAGAKPVSAEQMELTRLRAELGKSEDGTRHFKKRRWRTLRGNQCEVRPD